MPNCPSNVQYRMYLLNLLVFMWMRICRGVYILIISLKNCFWHLYREKKSAFCYTWSAQPYFDYRNVVWGNCNKSLATKLHKNLKSHRPYLDLLSLWCQCWQSFSSLAWTKPEALRKIQTVAMVYKSLHCLASQYLNSLLSYRNEAYSYSLWDSEGKLAIPLPRTNHVKNSFSYRGSVLWNSLLLSCGKRKRFPLFQRGCSSDLFWNTLIITAIM